MLYFKPKQSHGAFGSILKLAFRSSRALEGINEMGVYRRKDKGHKGGTWWISYFRAGKQYRESTGSSNKRIAVQVLAMRKAQLVEEKGSRPRSPRLGQLKLRPAVDYHVFITFHRNTHAISACDEILSSVNSMEINGGSEWGSNPSVTGLPATRRF
jgi:hypothetical protein